MQSHQVSHESVKVLPQCLYLRAEVGMYPDAVVPVSYVVPQRICATDRRCEFVGCRTVEDLACRVQWSPALRIRALPVSTRKIVDVYRVIQPSGVAKSEPGFRDR